jgi:integrase
MQTDLNKYKRYLIAKNNRPGTIKLRVIAANKFMSSLPGSGVIDEDSVYDFIYSLSNYATNTRNVYITGLKIFLDWKKSTGSLANESIDFTIPSKLRGKPRPIPESDFTYCLRSAPPKLYLAFCLAGYAGLRRAEICELKTEDMVRVGQRYHLIVKGKGEKERSIPASPKLYEAIKGYGGSDYLVSKNRDGMKISANSLGLAVTKYMHEHNMRWRLHSFRHRFASQVYLETKNIRLVQELLGHSSLTATQIYTSYIDEAGFDAIDNL